MLTFIVMLAAALGLQQPTTAELSGRVVDRSGGAMPGVTVTVEALAPTVAQRV